MILLLGLEHVPAEKLWWNISKSLEYILKDVDIEHKYITSTHIKPCAKEGRSSLAERLI